MPPPTIIVVDDSAKLATATNILTQETLQRVAFDCEGVNLGRRGSITIVQIGTPKATFLFDLLSPVKEESLALLKHVLECDKIQKVIHDPRADADALLHLHGVRVANCFDTQAFHEAILRETQTNLNRTLEAFGLECNELRDGTVYKKNPSFWAVRPMTSTMITWAAGDTQKLLNLADTMIQRASPSQLSHGNSLSTLKLNVLRDAKVETVDIHPNRVGLFIGRGGSNARALERATGAQFYLRCDTDGVERTVVIYAPNTKIMQKARARLAEYAV